MATTKSNWQDDLRQDITNKIVDGLKAGIVPWRRGWSSDPNCGSAINVVNKKGYRGINPLLLELTSLSSGYTSRFWGSYKQWTELGGQVRKGEHGTTVVFNRPLEVDDPKNKDATGKPKKKKIWLLRYYTVFNLTQVDGEKLDHLRPAKPDPNVAIALLPNWEPADRLIKATGAKIEYGGNRACYMLPSGAEFPKNTGGDYIQMPQREQFDTMEEWYSVHFHEISHWTAPRLGRKGGTYAFEELVAEISGCYVSQHLNVPNSDNLKNHTAYLSSWLKEMESDPKWIFRASQQASTAADFILAFDPMNKREDEEEHE